MKFVFILCVSLGLSAYANTVQARTITAHIASLTGSPDDFLLLGIAPTDTAEFSVTFDETLAPYDLSSVADATHGTYDRAFYSYQYVTLTIGAFSVDFTPLGFGDDIVVQDSSDNGTDGYQDSFLFGASDSPFSGLELFFVGAGVSAEDENSLTGYEIPDESMLNALTPGYFVFSFFAPGSNAPHEFEGIVTSYSVSDEMADVPLPAGLVLMLSALGSAALIKRRRA